MKLTRHFINFNFIILIFFISLPASAQTVISCSSLKGKAYYFPNVANTKGSWEDDGFSNGKRILYKNGENFDIFYSSPPDGKSVLKYGGQVFPLMITDDMQQFLAVDPMGYTEIYLFDLKNKIMSLSQHSTATVATKTATYIASCN